MAHDLLQRVRAICLALPDTEESDRLGGPHFYVRGKIFAGCGDDEGGWRLGVKVGLELQSILITRPGFHVAKYVGKHGWISVEAEALQDDAELRTLVQRSYDLIAAGAPAAKAPTAAKRRTQTRAAAKTSQATAPRGKAANPAPRTKAARKPQPAKRRASR